MSIKHSNSKKILKTGTVNTYDLPGSGGLRGLINELVDSHRNEVIRERKLSPKQKMNLNKIHSRKA